MMRSTHWYLSPRHPDMGEMVNANLDLSAVDGFVLPKFTPFHAPGLVGHHGRNIIDDDANA